MKTALVALLWLSGAMFGVGAMSVGLWVLDTKCAYTLESPFELICIAGITGSK